MGGYFGGELASRIAVDTAKELFAASDPDKTGFQTVLRECIDGAHQKIGENAATDELLSAMGSTVVLAVPTEQSVWIGNVGDSRAYLIITAIMWVIYFVFLVAFIGLIGAVGAITAEEIYMGMIAPFIFH